MGLDMYLEGEKFLQPDWKGHRERSGKRPRRHPREDGFEIKTKTLHFGYWRKHSDLHGYIVNAFASGDGNFERIWLSKDHLKQIIDAVRRDDLPWTSGFVIGATDRTGREDTLKIFEAALDWLLTEDEHAMRSVYYRASW